MLAVDAGVHLSSIIKILETTSGLHDDDEKKDFKSENGLVSRKQKTILPSGPFAGMELQRKSAKANASYIASVLVETYLITHPHLDHISGLVINSGGLPGTRPKRIAGLPSTIGALKTHIFNNIIWPNLSDENNGAGLVTFMRLVEGGSLAMGNGEGKGFIEVCEGLQVKTWSVSHGHCIDRLEHRSVSFGSPSIEKISRRSSSISGLSTGERARRKSATSERACVYDSSAFFIKDTVTGSEILIFGDVEPDSISLSPRNRHVWNEAAIGIVEGQLKGIFIECSYDDTRSADVLFGHLAPRYLIEEIKVLATEVERLLGRDRRKRKRSKNSFTKYIRRKMPIDSPQLSPGSLSTVNYGLDEMMDPTDGDNEESDEACLSSHASKPALVIRNNDEPNLPLKGIKIIIIHIKDKLDDTLSAENIILQQLIEHEKKAQLGCEFIISGMGQSIYF